MTDRRTQIYLTDIQHREATRLARERGTTLAAVVREALDRYLAAEGPGTADWEDDPALGLVGLVPGFASGAGSAADIDSVVYEEEGPWSSPTAPASSPSGTTGTRGTSARKQSGRTSRGRGRRS